MIISIDIFKNKLYYNFVTLSIDLLRQVSLYVLKNAYHWRGQHSFLLTFYKLSDIIILSFAWIDKAFALP